MPNSSFYLVVNDRILSQCFETVMRRKTKCRCIVEANCPQTVEMLVVWRCRANLLQLQSMEEKSCFSNLKSNLNNKIYFSVSCYNMYNFTIEQEVIVVAKKIRASILPSILDSDNLIVDTRFLVVRETRIMPYFIMRLDLLL